MDFRNILHSDTERDDIQSNRIKIYSSFNFETTNAKFDFNHFKIHSDSGSSLNII